MNEWVNRPSQRFSPMENHISDFTSGKWERLMGKWKLLSEMCFTDKLAGRYHSTQKHVVLPLNNFLFDFHSNTCVPREFMVNLYLSFQPPNSLNLYKSYFSILSSFFVFSWIISKACKSKGHVPTCTAECSELPEIFIGRTALSLISWQYIIKWCR